MTKEKLKEEFEKSLTIHIDMKPVLMYEKRATDQISDWWINKIQEALAEERESVRGNENTSDGYHTFKELYEFRKIYNAALFNEWTIAGKYEVHKSKKHGDGEECFGGGWFIMMATLPTGQISNHYELKDWDLFRCEERELANKWDGHTSQDVLTRLSSLDKPVTKKD